MKKSIKSLLFSVLIYPGAGHILLKKYISGLALIIAFSIPVFLIISEIIEKTNLVIARIESGDIPLDNTAITEAVANITSGTDGQMLDLKMMVMTGIWIVAAVDAYRLGKKEK